MLPQPAMTDDVIAEQRVISGLSALVRATMPSIRFQRHPGIAGVQIGDDGDLQPEAGRPLQRRQIVARDIEPFRARCRPIGCGRDAERTGAAIAFRKRRRVTM